MSKLSSKIILRIARQPSQDVWKLDDLLEVIKVKVEARKSSVRVRVSTQRTQILVKHVLIIQIVQPVHTSSERVQCIYCGKNHFSVSCDKICTVKE